MRVANAAARLEGRLQGPLGPLPGPIFRQYDLVTAPGEF